MNDQSLVDLLSARVVSIQRAAYLLFRAKNTLIAMVRSSYYAQYYVGGIKSPPNELPYF